MVLYDYYVENGGKMVLFVGWFMFIQYKDSIMEFIINCCFYGSLFDVFYMCGFFFKGFDVIDFLEIFVVVDIKGFKLGIGMFFVFINENGGVIDDIVIIKVF